MSAIDEMVDRTVVLGGQVLGLLASAGLPIMTILAALVDMADIVADENVRGVSVQSVVKGVVKARVVRERDRRERSCILRGCRGVSL